MAKEKTEKVLDNDNENKSNTEKKVSEPRSRVWAYSIDEPHEREFDLGRLRPSASFTPKSEDEEQSIILNETYKPYSINNRFRWFLCIHDKDRYTSEDEEKDANHKAGALKHKHIHIVIVFDNARTKKQALLFVEKRCNINKNAISVRIARNVYAIVQYLTHKNDSEKYQYNYEDILSNDYARLNYYYNHCEYDESDILEMIMEQKINQLDLIKIIGLELYKKYAYSINSIYTIMRNENKI